MRTLLHLSVLFLVACPAPEEICGNGTDDDGNGLIDCQDATCFGSECAEDCRTELDEDGDGLAGCADPDCVTALCAEDCENGIDDDGDGAIDCDDSACWAGGTCAEVCDSPFDEDGDGLIDCADPDCASETCDEQCDVAGDEDADGLADCADPDCWVATSGCTEVCDSGSDEDGDALVDCADPDCFTGGACTEVCESAADEDGDGLVACEDPDCWFAGGRCTEVCGSGNDEDADGLADCADDDCWVPTSGCAEQCDTASDEDGDGRAACADPDCWGAAGSCDEDCTQPGDEDGDGLADCEDPACATFCTESVCDDDLDDDNDGFIDCADDDCWGAGCAVGSAQITQMEGWGSYGSATFSQSSCASGGTMPSPFGAWNLSGSASGTVAYTGPQGTETTCGFTAVARVGLSRQTYGTSTLFERSSAAFSPDCTIQRPVQAFLPPDLRLSVGHAGTLRAQTVDGADWYVPSAGGWWISSSYSFSNQTLGDCVVSGQVRTGSFSGSVEGGPAFATVHEPFWNCDDDPGHDGCSASTAMPSCKALVDAGYRGPDGVFPIDPDGDVGLPPFDAWCDMTILGGGWTLVVHNDDQGNWANWQTDLRPSAASVGTYVPDPMASGDFYRRFDDLDHTEVLLASGDGSVWGAVSRSDAEMPPSPNPQLVTLIASSWLEPYTPVYWYYRGDAVYPEDPWMGIGSHPDEILYGEAGVGAHLTRKNSSGGANVFVR